MDKAKPSMTNSDPTEWMRDRIEQLERERGEATVGYAYREVTGAIDLDAISDTEEGVKLKYLEMCMGWRFEYPDRYDRDEEWARLLTHGSVVPIRVFVEKQESE